MELYSKKGNLQNVILVKRAIKTFPEVFSCNIMERVIYQLENSWGCIHLRFFFLNLKPLRATEAVIKAELYPSIFTDYQTSYIQGKS